MTHMPQAAARRNGNDAPEARFRRSPVPAALAIDLSAPVREIWRLTRRPPATCEAMAALAGFTGEGYL